MEIRPETSAHIDRARGMVQSLFSDKAYELYDDAVRTPISIDTVPNIAFEESRKRAILKIAEEMGSQAKGALQV